MKNDSIQIFISNINKDLLIYKTYSNLADFYGVSESSIKTWMNGRRNPKLQTLESISKKTKRPVFSFICNNEIPSIAYVDDNIHSIFLSNLKIFFMEKQAFKINQQLTLLQYSVSDFALRSYIRKENYKLPPLITLDRIADALEIPTYILLKEGKIFND